MQLPLPACQLFLFIFTLISLFITFSVLLCTQGETRRPGIEQTSLIDQPEEDEQSE